MGQCIAGQLRRQTAHTCITTGGKKSQQGKRIAKIGRGAAGVGQHALGRADRCCCDRPGGARLQGRQQSGPCHPGLPRACVARAPHGCRGRVTAGSAGAWELQQRWRRRVPGLQSCSPARQGSGVQGGGDSVSRLGARLCMCMVYGTLHVSGNESWAGLAGKQRGGADKARQGGSVQASGRRRFPPPWGTRGCRHASGCLGSVRVSCLVTRARPVGKGWWRGTVGPCAHNQTPMVPPARHSNGRSELRSNWCHGSTPPLTSSTNRCVMSDNGRRGAPKLKRGPALLAAEVLAPSLVARGCLDASMPVMGHMFSFCMAAGPSEALGPACTGTACWPAACMPPGSPWDACQAVTMRLLSSGRLCRRSRQPGSKSERSVRAYRVVL